MTYIIKYDGIILYELVQLSILLELCIKYIRITSSFILINVGYCIFAGPLDADAKIYIIIHRILLPWYDDDGRTIDDEGSPRQGRVRARRRRDPRPNMG